MSNPAAIDKKYKEATECCCCYKRLPLERKLQKRFHYRGTPLLYPEFGQCRVCGCKCCVSCLTLDSVCDTCLPTLND